ncbi:MAG: glycosyltransferase [Planctomycetes bacterium]|nr:glycosyltransferase [Planctomycetota bacterium]
MAAEPPAASPRPGMRLLLLAHPTVQLVRFGTKAALAWFLTVEDYGQVGLAGLLAFLASHAALLGLDEAWIVARRPGATLWRHLARLHVRSGLLLGAALALLGTALGLLLDDPLLLELTVALAPMVWIATLSVLPTAALVRAHRYPALFALDVAGVLSLAGVTIGAAALGAGPWSLVAGWYANALATVAAARVLAREVRPAAEHDDEDDPREVVRSGLHLAGADMANFAAERADALVVGFGVGRAALGLYDLSNHFGTLLVNYTGNLAERSLFPTLSAEHHADAARLTAAAPDREAPPGPGGFDAAFRGALGLVLAVLLPLHVLLATCAVPLLRLLFPERWLDAAPLLAALALAGGARCVEVVAATAIKSRGRSATVARLSLARLLVLAAATLAALPFGVVAVALAALGARVVGAALTLEAARTLLGPLHMRRPLRVLLGFCVGWLLLYTPLAPLRALSPWLGLPLLAACAAALWATCHLLAGRRAPRPPTAGLASNPPLTRTPGAPRTGPRPCDVSVVIATFDGERFLAETLDSVLAQSMPPREIVVVDDGSTDGTPDVLARYAGRITVVRRPNGGVSAARNAGAALAHGAWIAFLDHDDLWEPDMLERQLAAVAGRRCGLVYGDSWVIDDRGRVHGRRRDHLAYHQGQVYAELLRGNFIPIETTLMPTALFRELGGFDERLHFLEDYDLHLRVAAREPIVHQPLPVARYRIHDGNLSHRREELLGEWVLVLERMLADGTPRSASERALLEGQRAERCGDAAWQALKKGDLEAARTWARRAGERMPAGLRRRVRVLSTVLGVLPAPLARALRALFPRRRLYDV